MTPRGAPSAKPTAGCETSTDTESRLTTEMEGTLPSDTRVPLRYLLHSNAAARTSHVFTFYVCVYTNKTKSKVRVEVKTLYD